MRMQAVAQVLRDVSIILVVYLRAEWPLVSGNILPFLCQSPIYLWKLIVEEVLLYYNIVYIYNAN